MPKAGIIINTAKDTKNRQLLLAVIDSDFLANTIFFLEDGNRIQIQFLAPERPGESE